MGNPYGSLSLNGSSQYCVVSDDDDLDLGANDFALDIAFIVGGGSGTRVLLDKWSANVGWRVQINDSSALQFLFNASTYTVVIQVRDGEWHYFHVSVDRSLGLAYIFIDGALDGTLSVSGVDTVSNDSDLNLGWNGTSDYWNGKVSEVRLSSRVRHNKAFTQDIAQFTDDAWTQALYHFNEGQPAGGTAYDMSQYRNHMTITGTPSYVQGPYRACPPAIIYEQIWLALDTYSHLTTFLTARNGRKFRLRPGDNTPGNWTATNTPALLVMPTSMPEIEEETSAFHTLRIPMEIKGVLHFKSVYETFYFWWMVTEALWSMYNDNTTAGRFNYSRIQHMEGQGPSWELQETEEETLFSVFTDTFVFTTRHDLLGT